MQRHARRDQRRSIRDALHLARSDNDMDILVEHNGRRLAHATSGKQYVHLEKRQCLLLGQKQCLSAV